MTARTPFGVIQNAGHVYLIRDEEFVKIGWTKLRVEVRVVSLQCGNPRPLKLLASMPMSRSEEVVIHRRFAAHRVSGEWFRPNKEMWEQLGDIFQIVVPQEQVSGGQQ